jgi:hypothetical protein
MNANEYGNPQFLPKLQWILIAQQELNDEHVLFLKGNHLNTRETNILLQECLVLLQNMF